MLQVNQEKEADAHCSQDRWYRINDQTSQYLFNYQKKKPTPPNHPHLISPPSSPLSFGTSLKFSQREMSHQHTIFSQNHVLLMLPTLRGLLYYFYLLFLSRCSSGHLSVINTITVQSSHTVYTSLCVTTPVICFHFSSFSRILFLCLC